ncbi:MAG: hypothetical protein WAN03_02555 [Candidatus Sulfotelmatobacter sp.]
MGIDAACSVAAFTLQAFETKSSSTLHLHALARPRPEGRTGNCSSAIARATYQAPLDWIAMHVPQFLHAFVRSPNLEVVEASLPEGIAFRFNAKQTALRRVRGFLFGNKARAVRCLKTSITVEGVPISGSVMSK